MKIEQRQQWLKLGEFVWLGEFCRFIEIRDFGNDESIGPACGNVVKNSRWPYEDECVESGQDCTLFAPKSRLELARMCIRQQHDFEEALERRQ